MSSPTVGCGGRIRWT
uniref:Uncharacterized protein n=1 Tax=Rhizophora mucronata TaxID=61149 RepID=A0A2P2QNS1_RHIMU